MTGLSYSNASHRVTGFFRLQNVDWVLVFATLVTVFTGIMMIHSTEVNGSHALLLRQLTAAAVGLVGMAFLTVLPYQIFRTYVRPIYIVMIVVLVGVLIFGTTLRGTRGWFKLGPIFIQAPEVARLLFVLSIAGYLDRRIQWYSPKSLIVPFILALTPIGLILIEPDFSSSLVFFPVTIVMFYVAGARTLHLLAVCFVAGLSAIIPLLNTYLDLMGDQLKERAILSFIARALDGGWPGITLFSGTVVASVLFWWFLRKMRIYIPSLYLWTTLALLVVGTLGAMATQKVLKEYQRKRLVAFVSPDLDPLGGGYNVRQSQIAIGSGKVLGKGYGKGTQSRLGFLPSRHTDFIFSVIGEEMGFIRSIVVLGFYFMIIFRGFEISLMSRDRFGALVAAGFATMYAFYALLNVGMTMGMAPVAGVPLPMVSYGGSSLVASMFSIGILLSIYWRRYML